MSTGARRGAIDPIRLQVMKDLFASVAEEMGITLERTALSPNIKERLDFSCAIFDAEARMMAQAAHIPVGVQNVFEMGNDHIGSPCRT